MSVGVNGYGPLTEHWVLDATNWDEELKVRIFCPLTEDGRPIVGMMLISDFPPGPLVGVVHAEGQEAVEKWVEEHPELMKELGLEEDDDE